MSNPEMNSSPEQIAVYMQNAAEVARQAEIDEIVDSAGAQLIRDAEDYANAGQIGEVAERIAQRDELEGELVRGVESYVAAQSRPDYRRDADSVEDVELALKIYAMTGADPKRIAEVLALQAK